MYTYKKINVNYKWKRIRSESNWQYTCETAKLTAEEMGFSMNKRERYNRKRDLYGGQGSRQSSRRTSERSRSRQSSRRMTKDQRRDEIIQRSMIVAIGVFILAAAVTGYFVFFSKSKPAIIEASMTENLQGQAEVYEEGDNPVPRPEIDVQLLTMNEFSRPGIPTEKINGIVIHYLANPMTSAQDNHDFFESLKDVQSDYLSSNFIIGLEGEIIQCVPTNEVAYASNNRNNDTISIENCHPDETGVFYDDTYDSLVKLTAYLCGKYSLDTSQIIRHYDVTGKNCPKDFVENEDKWEQFKTDVGNYMEDYK